MRKRFHIERQVERLANSRTLDIIEGVLHKLANPSPILKDIRERKEFERKQAAEYEKSAFYKYPSERTREAYWSCDCLYCKIHRAYTFANIRAHIAEKEGSRRTADEHWLKIHTLKSLKEQLESLPLDQMLRSHIHEAKLYIGKSASSDDYDGMRSYQDLDNLRFKVQKIIAEYAFNPRKQNNTISWF